MENGNIFTPPAEMPGKHELFEEIFSNDDILIERIISNGQRTPEGVWLEQEKDEWVVLLQGSALLKFKNGEEISMYKGSYVLIPANTKHRVEETSVEPFCIWLAVHANLT